MFNSVVWMVKVFISLRILEVTKMTSLFTYSFCVQTRLIYDIYCADLMSFAASST